MSVYIAYRDLEAHYMQSGMCGGTPQNYDYRLTTVKDDVYLLTASDGNYAVTKERAERFVEEVLAGTTGKHSGSFPIIRELNGKKTAAVVEITKDFDREHYDFDDEVLLKMLDSLKAESEKLADKRALINYCYPNPTLPEGDFKLGSIYHQIYAPDFTPVSVIKSYEPDNKTSSLTIYQGNIFVEIREGQTKFRYLVPQELLPEIKEMVRTLCKDPAEAYVETGKWESFVFFGEKNERIFTDPDKTLALLKEIASKGVFRNKDDVPEPKGVQALAMPGFIGMQSMMMQAQAPAAQPSAQPAAQPEGVVPDEWECVLCGAKNKGRFCMNCGAPKH